VVVGWLPYGLPQCGERFLVKKKRFISTDKKLDNVQTPLVDAVRYISMHVLPFTTNHNKPLRTRCGVSFSEHDSSRGPGWAGTKLYIED